MPTPVLHNSSLYQRLFLQNPDYNFIKTFGCLCFHSFAPKLLINFKQKPFHVCSWLFLTTQGIPILTPIIGIVYISRHVVFDKSKFSCESSTIHNFKLQIDQLNHSPQLTTFPAVYQTMSR